MSRTVALVAGLAISLFAVTGFASEEAAGGGIVPLLLILAVFGAVFYFMLIRPQRKRQARQNELVQGLKRGDKIVTAGGIHGEIDSISDTSVVLSIEDGGKLRLSKGSVVSKQTK